MLCSKENKVPYTVLIPVSLSKTKSWSSVLCSTRKRTWCTSSERSKREGVRHAVPGLIGSILHVKATERQMRAQLRKPLLLLLKPLLDAV